MVWARCRPHGVAWLDQPTADQLADCAMCMVRTECLDYAVATRATDVVMGGYRLRRAPIARLED